MSNCLEEIYQTCRALAEHTKETELVPMIKAVMAEIDALQLYKNLADQYGLSVFEDIAALKEQRESLRNDLLDVLDCKNGQGPTALSIVMNERDALKEQVAQWKANHDHIVDMFNAQGEKLTTLQSKSAALVDALESARNGIVQWHVPENRYYAINAIDDALAAFKGE